MQLVMVGDCTYFYRIRWPLHLGMKFESPGLLSIVRQIVPWVAWRVFQIVQSFCDT